MFHPQLSLVERNNRQRRATSDTCAAPRLSAGAAGSRVSQQAVAGGRPQSLSFISHLERRLSCEMDDAESTALAGDSVPPPPPQQQMARASAKLGPAHAFRLGLGASERMESRRYDHYCLHKVSVTEMPPTQNPAAGLDFDF